MKSETYSAAIQCWVKTEKNRLAMSTSTFESSKRNSIEHCRINYHREPFHLVYDSRLSTLFELDAVRSQDMGYRYKSVDKQTHANIYQLFYDARLLHKNFVLRSDSIPQAKSAEEQLLMYYPNVLWRDFWEIVAESGNDLIHVTEAQHSPS